MRLLVTGRYGQVARALYDRARQRPDFEVVLVGRPDLDLERPQTIASAIRDVAPDMVINAAAYTAVDLAEDEPDLAMRINADAAAELARATRLEGIPILQMSTDYVFDGTGTQPYTEKDAPNPGTAYGRSKLAGEEAVRLTNPRHLIIRTSWVYSAYGRNFVKTMLELAQERELLKVVSDQVGNPSAAHDIAEGILVAAKALAHRQDTGRQLYHLAGSGSASWFEFARHLFAVSAELGGPTACVEPISSLEWPSKATRPINSQLDCSAFASDFGYRCGCWQGSVANVVAELVNNTRPAMVSS